MFTPEGRSPSQGSDSLTPQTGGDQMSFSRLTSHPCYFSLNSQVVNTQNFTHMMMFLLTGFQDGGTVFNRAVVGNTASGTVTMVHQIAKCICLEL